MDMYIADTHFGNERVMHARSRPWDSVEKMDAAMTSRWNSRVDDSDDVWIIGDFCHNVLHLPEHYLRRLNGVKHLIVGDHDNVILASQKARRELASIEWSLERVDAKGRKLLLCHCPLLKPPRGTWVIHGHLNDCVHVSRSKLRDQLKSVNVCADVNDYQPVTFEEAMANSNAWKALGVVELSRRG